MTAFSSDSQPKISIICALAKNFVIGNKNTLPWHLPADLRHFKELTLHKPVIMGRKTYESIGKALPQRRNIVITHQNNLTLPDCEIAHSLPEALALTKDNDEVMIIGGAAIFAQALPITDQMHLTIIQQDFNGDTFFPKWNAAEWQIIEKIDHPADGKNPYPYSFLTLHRIVK